MRNLVVCCDGTWQDMVDRSNVQSLYELLDESVAPCYVKGVGTGNLLDKLRGGLTGWGLASALLDGYRFIMKEYRPGDHISLFGFSRGACIACSLAGMIAGVGIVDRARLDDREFEAAVQQAYRRYQVLRAERKAAANLRGVEVAAATPQTRDGGTGRQALRLLS